MRNEARSTIDKTFEFKVNCFSVSQFYFRDKPLGYATADEMLDFVAQNFEQVKAPTADTLTLVWSRSTPYSVMDKISVRELANRKPGFPFGLVLEHSFVHIDEQTVYQKADPNLGSRIELISLTAALAPYVCLEGFEVTHHILI